MRQREELAGAELTTAHHQIASLAERLQDHIDVYGVDTASGDAAVWYVRQAAMLLENAGKAWYEARQRQEV